MNQNKIILTIAFCLEIIACIQVNAIFNKIQLTRSLTQNDVDFQKTTHAAKKNLGHESILSALPPLQVRVILPEFQLISLYLQRKTNVPIVLPTKVLDYDGKQIGQFYPYVYLSSLNDTNYTIVLGSYPKCRGGNGGCDRGLLSGQKIQPETPSLDALNAKHRELYLRLTSDRAGQRISASPFPEKSITLAKGIKGYYFPAICGANCHVQSTVVWDRNGYRYRVGISFGKRDAVIEMANSAIDNQL